MNFMGDGRGANIKPKGGPNCTKKVFSNKYQVRQKNYQEGQISLKLKVYNAPLRAFIFWNV